MNGKMLDELREMAEEDHLDTNTGIRLMLASQAEIIGNINDVKEEIKGIKKNPMIKTGEFVNKKPLLSLGIAFLTFVIFNAWAASICKEDILLMLGISPELLKLLFQSAP